MTTQTQYGGFWNRFAALFIDGLILILPQSLFGYLLGTSFVARFNYQDPTLIAMGYMLWAYLTAALISWIYFAAFESSLKQATPGKMALGLIVTDTQGRRVSFGRASGRFWAKILSSLPMGLGYLLVAVTPRKQALHDLLCQTLVQRKEFAQEMPQHGDAAGQDADAALYIQARNELKTMSVNEELWAKAVANHPTDAALQRAYYLWMRAAQLSQLPQLSPKQRGTSMLDYFRRLPTNTKVIVGIASAVILAAILGLIGGGAYYWYNNVYWKSYKGHPYFCIQYVDKSGEAYAYRKVSRIKYRAGQIMYIWNYNEYSCDRNSRGADTIIDSSPRDITILSTDPYATYTELFGEELPRTPITRPFKIKEYMNVRGTVY